MASLNLDRLRRWTFKVKGNDMSDTEKILSIKDLTVHYLPPEEPACKAVNGVSFDIRKGETLGLVGETGAGKTTIALSILRLVQSPPGKILSGSIEFNGENLLEASEAHMRKIRGSEISMIFQDPMTALNPIDSVGDQIAEVVHLHSKCSRAEARLKVEEMLELVGIDKSRYKDYPHQFSGGMKQRVIIAMALACSPELLIADEPTTALDVTIQAQVLDMMNDLKKKLGSSVLLITHDLGIVAEMCDKVVVMYAGQVVEMGDKRSIFKHTSHPYTKGLFGSLPGAFPDSDRLKPIKGLMPDPAALPAGCKFADRCEFCTEQCRAREIGLTEVSEGHYVRCVLAEGGNHH